MLSVDSTFVNYICKMIINKDNIMLIPFRSGKDRDRENGSTGRVMASFCNLSHLHCENYGLFLVHLRRDKPSAGTFIPLISLRYKEFVLVLFVLVHLKALSIDCALYRHLVEWL